MFLALFLVFHCRSLDLPQILGRRRYTKNPSKLRGSFLATRSRVRGMCFCYSAGGLYLRFSNRMAASTSILFVSSRAMMSCMTPGWGCRSPAIHCRTQRGSTPRAWASLLCHSRPYKAFSAVSMSAGSKLRKDFIRDFVVKIVQFTLFAFDCTENPAY